MFLKTSLPPKGKNTSRLTPSLEMTSVIIFQDEHSSVDGYIFLSMIELFYVVALRDSCIVTHLLQTKRQFLKF